MAANTVSAYRRDLSRYADFIGSRPLEEVGEADIAAYVRLLRAGDDDHPPLAASSTARALSAVRGLHRFAAKEGLVVVGPGRRRPPAGIAAPAAPGSLGR